MDIKIYAKILATHIQPILRHVIHPDQSCITTGRQDKENTMWTINLISRAQRCTLLLGLSVDAEKELTTSTDSFLNPH